jgi:hypothetical protein
MWKPAVPMFAVLFAGTSPSLTAVEVGDLTIGGYIETGFTYTDSSARNDPDLDFAGAFEWQMSYAIGSDAAATVHLDFPDSGSGELETAIVSWALTDQVTVMMGQYVNYIGWEAADAPARYLINRSILLSGNLYGAATNTGAAVFYDPSETIHLKLFLQDHVYGAASQGSSDAMAIVADAVFDIEGYGSVNAEIVVDQQNAAVFGGPVDGDVISYSANTTMTAIEHLVVGAEVFFVDYDSANALGGMVLANYAFAENISFSARLALVEPNDDKADDDGGEVGFALLTNPTGASNFAVNYEITRSSLDDARAGDVDKLTLAVEFLAVIP